MPHQPLTPTKVIGSVGIRTKFVQLPPQWSEVHSLRHQFHVTYVIKAKLPFVLTVHFHSLISTIPTLHDFFWLPFLPESIPDVRFVWNRRNLCLPMVTKAKNIGDVLIKRIAVMCRKLKDVLVKGVLSEIISESGKRSDYGRERVKSPIYYPSSTTHLNRFLLQLPRPPSVLLLRSLLHTHQSFPLCTHRTFLPVLPSYLLLHCFQKHSNRT